MVKYTQNYKFEKPEGADMYSVLPHNNNMDILDLMLGEISGESSQALSDSSSALTKATESQQLVDNHLTTNTWSEATLLNGWEKFGVGYEPKYTIDKHNNLIIKGAVKNGVKTKGTVLFELPINARPKNYRMFTVVNNNQNITNYQHLASELIVDPMGRVVIGSNLLYSEYLSIDEIRIQL